MKSYHVKCVIDGIKPRGLNSNKDGTLTSGVWPLEIEEAQQLVGGKLYLHESKAEKSYMGGTIIKVIPSYEPKFPNRVAFIFKRERTAENVRWKGDSHSMAWVSGIIDD